MKTLKMFAASVLVAMGLAVLPSAHAIQYELSGIGSNNDYGFGSHGLYLGDFDAQWLNHGYTNWIWTEMILDVDLDSGTATISGDMTRAGTHGVWGLNIALGDMSVDSDGNIEWDELTMSLTSPQGYDGVVPTEGWVGYEGMHDHVASLVFFDDGTVRFDAWYQILGEDGFYRFGDTKAVGSPVPVPAAIYLMLGALAGLGTMRRR